MEKTTISDVEQSVVGEATDRRGLSEPLGTTDITINYYRIPPGEGFPGGLHTHMDQEEVFVVIDGEATFETLAPLCGADCANSEGRSPSDRASVRCPRADGETESEDGEVTVGEREAIRFAPGEFHSGNNESNGELVAVAMGAPRDSEDVRIPVECPECRHDNLRLEMGEDSVTFVCPGCDVEHIPQDCPECGHDDLRVTLGDETRTVVVCRACETEFATPPLRDC